MKLRRAIYAMQDGIEMITFMAKPLSLNKCLQVRRIMEAGKRWKGYRVSKLEFDLGGLVKIHITKN